MAILRHPTISRLLTSGPSGWPGSAALVVRLVAGTTIAAFGVGKFTRHDAEAAAFDTYGIPFADRSPTWSAAWSSSEACCSSSAS